MSYVPKQFQQPFYAKLWFWAAALILLIPGWFFLKPKSGTETAYTSAPASTVEAADPLSLESVTVTMELNVVQDVEGFLQVGIQTNLPDGTLLLVTLSADDYVAQMPVSITGGAVATDLFTYYGEAFPEGLYLAKVTMSSMNAQSEAVKEVIGERGEYMNGSLVVAPSAENSNYSIRKEQSVVIDEQGRLS